MMGVLVAALAVTPFAWMEPEARLPMLLALLTIGTFSLILISPYLLDFLDARQPRAKR
jgi:hypothetical protein